MVDERDIGIFSASGDTAGYVREVDAAIESAKQNLLKSAAEKGGLRVAYAQGFFAEAWHTETFNLDAAVKRMRDLHAHMPKSNALKSADVIVRGPGTDTEVGAKYWSTGKNSVDEQKGYGDQRRLIPSDQVAEANAYLDRQIEVDAASAKPNRQENAARLREVRDNLTDRIEVDGVMSKPLGRNESEARTKRARRGEVAVQADFDVARIGTESLRAGAVAAGITIGATVAPRIYDELLYRHRAGEFQDDALKRIFHGTASTAAEAALRASVATAITISARAGALGEAARGVNPTLVGTLTYLAIEAAKDIGKYQRGEITEEQLADGMMRKSVVATAGAYGAAIAQVVIPIPFLGAMIGATLGSIIASAGYKFLDTAAEVFFRSDELEELAQITGALAGEWEGFLRDYHTWRVARAIQTQQIDAVHKRMDARAKRHAAVNRRSLDALNEGDE